MLWLVLLSCLIVHCEYEHYNLSSLCAHPGSAISLYLGVQESVFSVNSPHAGVEDCHLQLRVFSHTFGQAVFIKKMRSDNCNYDYLQFGRHGDCFAIIILLFCFRSAFLGLLVERSKKYCENIDLPTEVFNIDGSLQTLDFGFTPYSSRSYVEESEDTMDLWINLTPQTHTEQDSVSFVVTPFPHECVDGDAVYRQCPGSHSCVRRQLFCDRVVNCPHAEQESEETDCRFPHLRGGSFNNFPLSLLILFLILTIVSLIIIGWKVKRNNREEHERIENQFQVKVKQKNEVQQGSSSPINMFLPRREMLQRQKRKNNQPKLQSLRTELPNRQLSRRQIRKDCQPRSYMPRRLKSELLQRLKSQKRLPRSQMSNRQLKRQQRSKLLRMLRSQKRLQRRSKEDRRCSKVRQSKRYMNNDCTGENERHEPARHVFFDKNCKCVLGEFCVWYSESPDQTY